MPGAPGWDGVVRSLHYTQGSTVENEEGSHGIGGTGAGALAFGRSSASRRVASDNPRGRRRSRAPLSIVYQNRMARCGESQNGGRYGRILENGNTSGLRLIPTVFAMKSLLASIRLHASGNRSAKAVRCVR